MPRMAESLLKDKDPFIANYRLSPLEKYFPALAFVPSRTNGILRSTEHFPLGETLHLVQHINCPSQDVVVPAVATTMTLKP